MFDEMHIEDFKLLEPHEQTHFALLRFYVSNWIIEVLNVVCLQPDKDMENKNVYYEIVEIISTEEKERKAEEVAQERQQEEDARRRHDEERERKAEE